MINQKFQIDLSNALPFSTISPTKTLENPAIIWATG